MHFAKIGYAKSLRCPQYLKYKLNSQFDKSILPKLIERIPIMASTRNTSLGIL